MEIVNSNANMCRLSSLAAGTVFEYHYVLYLKTDKLDDGKIICVRLGDGHIDWFIEECSVYKLDVKAVIE